MACVKSLSAPALSPVSVRDWSQGGAYVHNLFAGRIISRPEPNRWTPYHRPHSTALAGVTYTRGGDNRYFINIFTGGAEAGLWVYDERPFPSFAAGNVYLNGARPYKDEQTPLLLGAAAPPAIQETPEGVFLRWTPPAGLAQAAIKPVTTARLGRTLIAELPFEDVDAAPLRIEKPLPGPLEKPAALLKLW